MPSFDMAAGKLEAFLMATVLRGEYRVSTQENAMRCAGLRNEQRAANVLKRKNFREISPENGHIFPSWTSQIQRFRAPATIRLNPHRCI
jgi:hypothetical protein